MRRVLAEGSSNQRNCAQTVGVKLRYVEAEWHGLGDPLDLEALADAPSLALPKVAYPKCGTVWSTAGPATRRSGW